MEDVGSRVLRCDGCKFCWSCEQSVEVGDCHVPIVVPWHQAEKLDTVK
jgi:hypothetical protein